MTVHIPRADNQRYLASALEFSANLLLKIVDKVLLFAKALSQDASFEMPFDPTGWPDEVVEEKRNLVV